MFYDEFIKLCNKAHMSPTSVAKDIGFAGAHVTKWKNGSQPTDATKYKICDYFGLPYDYFERAEKRAKKASTPQGERSASKEDVIFALFRGREDITDEMYNEVLNFADYVAQREAAKKKGNK